jgi:hypothetical protein
VDDSGNLSEFSQRGPRVLAGLGERVLSTVPDHIYGADGLLNDWAVSTGTSMAAPHIAGASVLVREAMQAAGWDSIAPTTIYEHLRTTADLVFDATTNAWYHRINLPRAVDAILFHEPVRLVDDKVVVEGTADDDVIDIELEDEFVVTLNGQRFTFSPASATRFEIAGGEGTDQLCVEGSLPLTSLGRESTSTILAPGSLDIHAISWQLSANDFEQVTVVAPGGYDDVARLYDSTNADEFVSHPDENVMRGNGFEHRVIGFDRVYAYASGQDDVATMLDSGGSDQFISRPDSSILKGRGFHNKALGFARVYAYASTGKDDVARFYDAPTKDHFTASPTSAVLAGDGFRNEAQGFFRTYAYSSGGSDEALLLDSTGSDEFVATAGDARLRGTGFFHKVFNFAQVSAIASEGRDDVARLHDSPHDDLFQATPKSSTLRGDGFANRATGFDRVYGYASDGVDQAQLTGSWASDRYYSWVGKNVLRGPGYYMDVRGFEQTHVDLVTGRDDVAYLFDSSQADSYVGAGNRGLWQAGGFTSLIDRLDRVRAFSDRGGNDLALLQASMPVMLTDDGSTAVLRDRQARHEVNDFEQVSTDGLVDEDYLATLDHLFEFAS